MIKPTKKDSFYDLRQNRQGKWVLSVLCGGIGMYESTLVLNDEEIEMIEEYGEYYVEKIALDVSTKPEAFGDRLKMK
jgi:hypothetical protein